MTDFLQGDVDVPGLGKTKKVWIYGGLGVAGSYVAWRWYQASRLDDEPSGSDGMYTTPDQTELGLSTAGGAGNVTGNTGNQHTDGRTPGQITTNAEWTNAAVDLLGNAGYEASVVYAALGEFLARRALDKTEASIARASIAAAGQPPQNGPFSVIEEAGEGTGTLGAPGGLKVAPGSDRATVSWTAVAGAGSYHLYRNDQSTASPQVVAGTSLIMYNLDPGREYKVWVAAVGTTGKEGAKSGQVTFKTGSPKLIAPGNLKAVKIDRTQVTVTYGAVPGARGYVGFRTGAYTGAGQSDNLSMTIGGLKPGTKYTLSVAAKTGVANAVGPKASITVTTKK